MTVEKSFRMRLAGRTVEVLPIHGEVRKLCRDYLVPPEGAADITVKITPEDIAREAATAAGRYQGTMPLSWLETTAVHRKIAGDMLRYDIFLMHGAVVSTAGRGYMITAPSGTGKTTRVKLWADHIPDSRVINGDKPFLRIGEDGAEAFGTPWCGKEGWNVNTSVPLRAIFILERSQCGNSAERLSFAEAFPALLRQTYRPDGADGCRKTLRLLEAMAGKVAIFRFRSEPTPEAVRMAFEAAGGDLRTGLI